MVVARAVSERDTIEHRTPLQEFLLEKSPRDITKLCLSTEPSDLALAALNSTGEQRVNALSLWEKLDPINAVPTLLRAADSAKAGNLEDAWQITKAALARPKFEDYEIANRLEQAKLVAANGTVSLRDVYNDIAGYSASLGKIKSAMPELISMGELMFSELQHPNDVRETDKDKWVVLLGLANKASDTSTMWARTKALEYERQILDRLPNQFESVLDRDRRDYRVALTQDLLEIQPLLGEYARLWEGPEHEFLAYLDRVSRLGEINALRQR
ncbi:MAG: hypothetical protein ACR2OZ_13950 [Verrucomicrobiales bacterium]